MRHIISKSLMAKLIVFFLAVALVPIALVGYLAFLNSSAALEHADFKGLEEGRELVKAELKHYFLGIIDQTRSLAVYDRALMAVEKTFTPSESGSQGALTAKQLIPTDEAIKEGETGRWAHVKWAKINTRLDTLFGTFIEYNGEHNGYDDLLLVGAKDGVVRYSVKKLSDLGANLKTSSLKNSGLAKVWEKVVTSKKPALTDMAVYEPTKTPAMFAGVPVFGQGNEVSGVLAVRMGTRQINAILAEVRQMGESAEAYVAGNDLLMRSDSRFVDTSTILKRKCDTVAVQEALACKQGEQVVPDYRGVPVLSAYSPVGISDMEELGADFDWAVMAEIDQAEVMGPINTLGLQIGGVAVAIGIVVFIIAFFLSRSIARPMTVITERVAKVSDGDLTVELPALKRKDELGILTEAVRKMLENLRKQINGILEGVNVLSNATAEISATVSQVVSGNSQTSAAVSETTATVSQVKQAASLSREKAQSVAESSQKAVVISRDGRKATEDTVDRMNLIKEQMESIGETVVRLSEHSQAIEAIIGSVQDLADQSNLLAVNASIEAARAGDQGKGFAVVAHEIKTLADQSKEATEQVRTILEDTRKWVSAVVMATEQGSKAVDAGVGQSVAAGEAIGALANSVMESSQVASVIQSTSDQQVQGVEQVATAMANIESAVQQNLSGTNQLEEMARQLNQLGASLKDMVNAYRV